MKIGNNEGLFLHCDLSQVEKKYGGSASDLNDFWPPKLPNSHETLNLKETTSEESDRVSSDEALERREEDFKQIHIFKHKKSKNFDSDRLYQNHILNEYENEFEKIKNRDDNNIEAIKEHTHKEKQLSKKSLELNNSLFIQNKDKTPELITKDDIKYLNGAICGCSIPRIPWKNGYCSIF